MSRLDWIFDYSKLEEIPEEIYDDVRKRMLFIVVFYFLAGFCAAMLLVSFTS